MGSTWAASSRRGSPRPARCASPEDLAFAPAWSYKHPPLTRRLAAILSLSSLLLGAGCAPQHPPSAVASSSGEPGYAARYPEEVEALTRRLDERQQELKKLDAGFSSYPDQLKDVKKELALEVIERADEAGRSHAYVERLREADQGKPEGPRGRARRPQGALPLSPGSFRSVASPVLVYPFPCHARLVLAPYNNPRGLRGGGPG